jgi:hypothetical protein
VVLGARGLVFEEIENELGVRTFAYTLPAPFRLAAAAFAGPIVRSGGVGRACTLDALFAAKAD